MSRTPAPRATPLLLAFALAGLGCEQKPHAAPDYKLHDVRPQFSKAELNAPLSAQARARGAQVAPPPVR